MRNDGYGAHFKLYTVYGFFGRVSPLTLITLAEVPSAGT
jgi:hypothetical protein